MTLRSTIAATSGIGLLAALPVFGSVFAQEEDAAIADGPERNAARQVESERMIRRLRAELEATRRELREERAARASAEDRMAELEAESARRPARGWVRVGGPDALVSVGIPGASRSLREAGGGAGDRDDRGDRGAIEAEGRDLPDDRDRDRADAVRLAGARVEAERARVEAAEFRLDVASDRQRLYEERAKLLRDGVASSPLETMRERLETLERMHARGLASEVDVLDARADLDRAVAEQQDRLGIEARARIDELDARIALVEADAQVAEARARLVEAEADLARDRREAGGDDRGREDRGGHGDVVEEVFETAERVIDLIRRLRRDEPSR